MPPASSSSQAHQSVSSLSAPAASAFTRGRGTVRITGSPGERVEIGLDPVLQCLDACDSPPAPTPGYVSVVR